MQVVAPGPVDTVISEGNDVNVGGGLKVVTITLLVSLLLSTSVVARTENRLLKTAPLSNQQECFVFKRNFCVMDSGLWFYSQKNRVSMGPKVSFRMTNGE